MDQTSRGKYYTAAASFIRQYVALARQAARLWGLKLGGKLQSLIFWAGWTFDKMLFIFLFVLNALSLKGNRKTSSAWSQRYMSTGLQYSLLSFKIPSVYFWFGKSAPNKLKLYYWVWYFITLELWSTKMMCHLARDAQTFGRNARYHHCFGDEDGMQWLKRNLVNY